MAKRLRTVKHAPMKAVDVTELRLKDKKMVLLAFISEATKGWDR